MKGWVLGVGMKLFRNRPYSRMTAWLKHKVPQNQFFVSLEKPKKIEKDLWIFRGGFSDRAECGGVLVRDAASNGLFPGARPGLGCKSFSTLLCAQPATLEWVGRPSVG